MCSTTTPNKNKSPPDAHKTPAPGTAGAAPPPLTPFAAIAYAAPNFTKDDKLQPALESARTEMAAQLGPGPVAFSFLFRHSDGRTRYGGVDDEKMHYSGSVLKVAAMYAAHELLAAARRLAQKDGPHRASPAAFFSGLESTFDQMIKDAAAPLKAAGKVDQAKDGADVFDAAARVAANVTNPITGLKDYRATPTYRNIFDVAATGAGPPVVKFKARATSAAPEEFSDFMRRMIVASDEDASGECIRRLSYTYINAALMKGGFYNPGATPPKGVWLAGDYTGTRPVNQRSSVARIMSENDQLVAQVMTTKEMLRIVWLINDNRLAPLDGGNPMKDLLAAAVDGAGSFLRPAMLGGATPPFTVKLNKLGYGPLKAGLETHSEVQFLKWTAPPDLTTKGLKEEFFVCWQNLHMAHDDISRFRFIVEVIRRTVTKLMNAL